MASTSDAVRRFAVALGVLLLAGAASAQDIRREITNIAGDLYRFQKNFQTSVFLVTDDGIIATDPINVEAAQWRKAELDSRMEDLRAEVLASRRAGRTLEETQQAVTLDAYKDWGQYENWLPLNIAGM